MDDLDSLLRELRIKKELFTKLEDQYKKGIGKLELRLHWIGTKMDEYEAQYQAQVEVNVSKIKTLVDEKRKAIVKSMDMAMSELTTKVVVVTSECNKLFQTITTHSMNINNMSNDIIPTAQSLKHVTTQMNFLLKTYQDKTTILDTTIDVLHEEMDITFDWMRKQHPILLLTEYLQHIVTEPSPHITCHSHLKQCNSMSIGLTMDTN